MNVPTHPALLTEPRRAATPNSGERINNETKRLIFPQERGQNRPYTYGDKILIGAYRVQYLAWRLDVPAAGERHCSSLFELKS